MNAHEREIVEKIVERCGERIAQHESGAKPASVDELERLRRVQRKAIELLKSKEQTI